MMASRIIKKIMSTDPLGFDTTKPAGAPLALSLTSDCAFEMVWCPPGVGVVGSEKSNSLPTIEQPRQKIKITRGFWIATTPVTLHQMQRIMSRPSTPREETGRSDHPVVGATWSQSRMFCSKATHLLREIVPNIGSANIELPTEAQWEYACRAGTTERWYFGEDESLLDEFAWYASNSGGIPHPVATRQANPWGIYDLYGNVAEWCRDEFRRYDENEIVNPMQSAEDGLMKLVRGGDYASPANECRSACRAFCDNANINDEPTGFRIVINRS